MSDTSTTGQKVAAEIVGTFVLVFFGISAAVLTNGDLTAIALAFGLSLVVGVYAFGRISGAHFNPAVSVGAAMSGRMSWRQVPVYAGAQVLGGVVAAGLLWVLLKAYPDGAIGDDRLGQNFFGDGGFAWWGALLVEVVATAILVAVILAVTDARNEHPGSAPLVIGLALVAIHLATIPMTGTSVNPARSIGPALFSGTDSIKDLWLFILAPLVGAAIAGLAYPAVFGHGADPVPGSGLALGRPAAGGAVPGYGAPDQFQQEWNQQDVLVDATTAYEPEPIIQDGWQWDHAAQEWKPLEQWTSPDASAEASAGAAVDPVFSEPAHAADPDPLGSDPLGSDPLESSTAAVDPTPTRSTEVPPEWGAGSEDTQIRPRDS